MKINLAGPLFSAAERAFNVQLADRLRMAGHKVWLPQESEQRSISPLPIRLTISTVPPQSIVTLCPVLFSKMGTSSR